MHDPRVARTAVPYADPLHAGRHPFQTFMLVLCVFSGVPLLFGEPPAASVEALLPPWMAVSWGVSLCLGALVALVGSYWPRGRYATALTMERAGLCIVGPAALVYGTLIGMYSGSAGFAAASITIGFGLSCLKRAHDIGKVITRAIAKKTDDPMDRPLREDEDDTPMHRVIREGEAL